MNFKTTYYIFVYKNIVSFRSSESIHVKKQEMFSLDSLLMNTTFWSRLLTELF